MKNKSIVMKILVFGSIILVLLLLVVISSLINIFLPKEKEESKKIIISKNYSLDNVDNISFNFKKANSTFEISDTEELTIVQNHKEEKFYLNYKVKDSNAYFEEDSYIINPQQKNYIIYIPMNYKGKITLINGFGKVEISDIINDLYINNNSGKLTINNSKNMRIKDVSGDISLSNIEGNIVAESTTGDIIIDNLTGITNIESITGDIIINKFSIVGDSFFENVSGDIILDMEQDSLCKINASNERGKTSIDEKACNSLLKINMINVKNITGSIKIF